MPEGWRARSEGLGGRLRRRGYREKWPDYLAAIEAPNALGVHHETAQVTRGDAGAHNMLVSFAYVLALAAGAATGCRCSTGAAVSVTTTRSLAPCAGARARLPREGDARRRAPGARGLARGDLPRRRVVPRPSLRPRRRELLAPVRAGLAARSSSGSRTATGGYLYIARVPVALHSESFVVLQRAVRPRLRHGVPGLGVEPARAARGRAACRWRASSCSTPRFSAAGAPENPVEHRSFLFNR